MQELKHAWAVIAEDLGIVGEVNSVTPTIGARTLPLEEAIRSPFLVVSAREVRLLEVTNYCDMVPRRVMKMFWELIEWSKHERLISKHLHPFLTGGDRLVSALQKGHHQTVIYFGPTCL